MLNIFVLLLPSYFNHIITILFLLLPRLNPFCFISLCRAGGRTDGCSGAPDPLATTRWDQGWKGTTGPAAWAGLSGRPPGPPRVSDLSCQFLYVNFSLLPCLVRCCEGGTRHSILAMARILLLLSCCCCCFCC
jgi:hypothetical protein